MSTERVFQIHLVLGYVAWLLCLGAYILPWLRSLERPAALRAIALLHGFRFFGLAFLVPGVVSANVPASFAVPAAYGDFATGVLALLAFVTFRVRAAFWSFVIAFNLLGAVDLVLAYAHAIAAGLPQHAGDLGIMYPIPVLYVPLLMITHVVAFYFLLQRGRQPALASVTP